MMDSKPGKFQFAIDRGGTFTDIFAKCPDGKVRVMKLLSVDPKNYSDAPTEGIRRILESETGNKYPPDEKIDASNIEWIRMGTTVATNALLERKGERIALLVTKGFKDVLFIGNQARPKLFDLAIVKPDMLYEEVVEVRGRILPKREDCLLDNSWPVLKATTDEDMFETEPLDEEELKSSLKSLLQKGIQSIAVALMHSYMNPIHEMKVEGIAMQMGFTHVSLSSSVMPMVRIVPRGHTAAVDAYLTPAIQRYLAGFSAGFSNNLRDVNVTFMQSDGGLTPMDNFNGSRAILSGPAGGVVGYATTTRRESCSRAIIGFDMGGTSTDVSRFDGAYEHVFETTTAGVTIQAPQLDISTVAAGGGSVLTFKSGLFAAGPESAGAHPGPVCYRKNGPLTITDANLVLRRLLPSYFPKIFGPDENDSLDKEASKAAFEALKAETPDAMSVEEIAMGFIKVANETMCRPIRNLTQGKGYDTRDHVLACFGGAGGQHACAIARSLGMATVYIHKYAGILSAYGMALADVIHEEQAPSALEYNEGNLKALEEGLDQLAEKCVQALEKQGFTKDKIHSERFLHMRYQGTDCALMCTNSDQDYLTAFLTRYKTEFGFTLQNRSILVDDIRVRGIGRTDFSHEEVADTAEASEPEHTEITDVFFDTCYLPTRVFKLENLTFGHAVEGPAIIMDKLSTILVEPGCKCFVTKQGNLRIEVSLQETEKIGTTLDPVQLSVFSHRFMSIAEQMGRILQRTSISTNIKERLDFSCALFGPDGGLVSNAPHIPVHLGAMQSTVRYQMTTLGENLNRGDVLLANHPQAGGSHLPDLTVITPVFYEGIAKPVFFVANRGHHADIGGISPGSMPPHSKHLWEEGAHFKSFKIVKGGVFQEEALIEALNAPGKYPGCSGTRLLQDNLSDLKAQIAANQRGIQLVTDLISSYSLEVVQAYMSHIQTNAEVAVRQVLKKFGREAIRKTGKSVLEAEDFMDDGSLIGLRVAINVQEGSAIFDFSRTGPEVWGNINAPKAVTHSALIYSLRCLVGEDIPLNQGCLNPVEIIIPEKSILDPSENAAVVGGNVLTSQRVVDVILRAFEAAAASQGCCNNITFGDERFGYYETVAGGSGAGPTWHGRSGVHVHMTNTRLTDPEILERRYPVMLKEFHLNPGSGGRGLFNGGDGVLRSIMFLKSLTLSVLTDRRVISPYGLRGGECGQRGQNLLVRRSDGVTVNLGGKCSVPVEAGDVFVLKTPGGGGWGTPC